MCGYQTELQIAPVAVREFQMTHGHIEQNLHAVVQLGQSRQTICETAPQSQVVWHIRFSSVGHDGSELAAQGVKRKCGSPNVAFQNGSEPCTLPGPAGPQQRGRPPGRVTAQPF